MTTAGKILNSNQQNKKYKYKQTNTIEIKKNSTIFHFYSEFLI